MGNWYSIEKEKEIGQQLSTSLESSVEILRDGKTTAYMDQLAQRIAQNSDVRMPVIVRVIGSQDVYALTLPGGYLYVTQGLVLRVGSEGELASVLARGIAHTALRTAARESTRAQIMSLASIPPLFADQSAWIISTSDTEFTLPLGSLKWRRDEELDADYFGVQYLYKSGYDPDCFMRFVRTVWPANSPAVSVFSPRSDRLAALAKEVSDVLPRRDGETTSTPEFTDVQEHLRSLPGPAHVETAAPTLLRGNERPSK